MAAERASGRAPAHGELMRAAQEDPVTQIAEIFDFSDPDAGLQVTPGHPPVDLAEAPNVAQYLRLGEPVPAAHEYGADDLGQGPESGFDAKAPGVSSRS
jgi:hypothetical protein